MGDVRIFSVRKAIPMRPHIASHGRIIDTLSHLFGCVDSAEFPLELARTLREITPVDRLLLYVLQPDQAPLILHSESESAAGAKRAAQVYFGGGYRYDPYYRAFMADNAGGFCSGVEDEGGEGRWSQVQHVAYLSPVSRGVSVAALLVRSPGSRVFSSAELQRLRALEGPILTALRLHWTTWAAQHAAQPVAESRELHREVELAIDHFGQDVMTPREAEVVRLLLRGHTTKAAAERLGIAVATTALHRKRSYAKLGVCSQAELFYRFLCSIATTEIAPVIPLQSDASEPRRPRSQAAWPRAVSGVS